MVSAILKNRKFWLGSLLLLTVVAAFWPTSNINTPSAETKNGSDSSRRHNTANEVKIAFSPLDGETKKTGRSAIGNLFPQQTWAPPSAPNSIPQITSAPPLPFTYGGRYIDGSDTMVFLIDSTQVYKVRQGETFKENYKVEKIETAAISIIYLPQGTRQILPTGSLLP